MNIDPILRSIVTVRSSIPEDAFTAKALGTQREGSGVVIRENGLVLTIGYLITEADEVWLTSSDGLVVPAHALAYDQETGFGLVQALDRLDLPAVDLGDASETRLGDPVVLADGIGRAIEATIVAKQEFAGYWEYLLDEAIFIAPAHPWWGGAALIGPDGKLLGIGSLRLQMSRNGETTDINMVVPIDLLPPILDDLLTRGQVSKPPRPWLGAFSAESNGEVVVMSVAEGGPAAQAGLRQGDIISDIRDEEVDGLADFYRKVWEKPCRGGAAHGAVAPACPAAADTARWPPRRRRLAGGIARRTLDPQRQHRSHDQALGYRRQAPDADRRRRTRTWRAPRFSCPTAPARSPPATTARSCCGRSPTARCSTSSPPASTAAPTSSLCPRDGKRAVSVHESGAVIVWDIENKSLLHVLRGARLVGLRRRHLARRQPCNHRQHRRDVRTTNCGAQSQSGTESRPINSS